MVKNWMLWYLFHPNCGGVIGVIQALSVHSPEMAALSCAGSLGLLFIALGISKIDKKYHS